MDDYKTWVQPYLSSRVIFSNAISEFDSWVGQIKPDSLMPGMSIESAEFSKPIPCERMCNVHVRANGDIRLCGCRIDYRKEKDAFKVGHIEQDTIVETFNSKKAKNLVNTFRTGNLLEECKDCAWYT